MLPVIEYTNTDYIGNDMFFEKSGKGTKSGDQLSAIIVILNYIYIVGTVIKTGSVFALLVDLLSLIQILWLCGWLEPWTAEWLKG